MYVLIYTNLNLMSLLPMLISGSSEIKILWCK